MLWLMHFDWHGTPEELEAQEKAKQEQIDKEKAGETSIKDEFVVTPDTLQSGSTSDSIQNLELKNKFGVFGYSASLPTAKQEFTTVGTEYFDLKFSHKGGFLSEVKLKQFVNFDSIPIYLIKENNSNFNINFGTTDSRILNTKDLYFQPSVTENGENTIVSMKLKVSPSQYLEYRYALKPNDYMIEFSIHSQGLNNVINSSQEINLDWSFKGIRN